jgi:hypothetical protein
MLVIEHTSNGQRIVKLRKDWHPSMMSKAYQPRQKNYVDGIHMQRLQTALLRKDRK